MRYEDRKGRVRFALPLVAVEASVGDEKARTNCIVRGIFLFPIAVVLSAGMASPLEADCELRRPLLLLRVDKGAEGVWLLRWYAPKKQLQLIADAINRAPRQPGP